MLRTDFSTADLRRFGWQLGLALPVLFCGVLPWLIGYAVPWWPCGVSLVLLGASWLKPQWLFWPCRGWFLFSFALSYVNSRLLLVLMFYLLVLPFGLVTRLFGKLGYQSKAKKVQDSYWRQADSADIQMKDPF